MTGYKIINLIDMISEVGEDETTNILSTFYCPRNRDVEFFLKKKAIEFSKMGLSRTHLVYASYKKEPVLVGYFAIANKTILIPAKLVGSSSSTFRKRVNKFATFDSVLKAYTMATPLIAQLGKNYLNHYDKLITGDELLHAACEKISRIQFELGGRFAYLECEDDDRLINFYKRNGFCEFNTRALDKDETDTIDGDYLVQMIKYIEKRR